MNLTTFNFKDNAIRSMMDDEKADVGITDTLGGKQEATIINESGLYSLILTSRKSEARYSLE